MELYGYYMRHLIVKELKRQIKYNNYYFIFTEVDCLTPGPFYYGFIDGIETTFNSVVHFK